ncbi:nucleotide-binding protein containing TIR -like protein domain-like protein [Chlorobaculum parvum NCIB 8327]|uniref:Nucleotide-binding protein containing TIR-like protein domain-like protein n=1 Tax=Chlorobaculum parvum (strain DSM 263 / NCIMB 8327) TaxID=517417 RepID=B3QLE0_CHLP8|nr:nucleotide-binding protein [Chlorobaculum parvum]ACF12378.1 nucleotide-binding protein containing TIR -like protein domain-like protein [Chlorobaculum parvum NCIB 8327]
MAKEQPLQRKPANLKAEQMKRGIARLEQRIAEFEEIDVNTIENEDDSPLEGLILKANSTLQDILGYDSIEYFDYKLFESISISHFIPSADITLIKSLIQKELTSAVRQLKTLKELFEERIADAEALPENPTAQSLSPINTGKVFIVHGHDHGVKETVARFIEKLGLEPIILHEQPNEGKTVIEKIERHATADFAVVLFTPDDTGYPSKKPDDAKPRARQNVVLELGYFMARLGRNRVALLQVGDDIEIPSDFSGVLYLTFDNGGGWKYQLASEMKARGMAIDMNNV